MKRRIYLSAIFVVVLVGLISAQQIEPVKVEQGLLQGTLENGVTVYKGVPFAKPPVEELRWRPPQPPEPWEGVRKADKYSPNAMQIMVDC